MFFAAHERHGLNCLDIRVGMPVQEVCSFPHSHNILSLCVCVKVDIDSETSNASLVEFVKAEGSQMSSRRKEGATLANH
jgi:hypothetical protein